MLINDENGMAAVDKRSIYALRAVQMYGPMIFELITQTPRFFTLDFIYNMMNKTRYKKLGRRVAHTYISYLITYVNESAMPYRIVQKHEGNRYWYELQNL